MQYILEESYVVYIELKVEISLDDLSRFISVLSPYVNCSDSYLRIHKENGVYAMAMCMEYTEEAMKCISFLHYLGNIQQFLAKIYDQNSNYGDERIILENGVFYHFEVEIDEASYAETENEQWHYDTFRRLILFNEGITNKDYYSSTVPVLTRDLFYQAIEEATTLDELKKQLVVICGDRIEFREGLFNIEIAFIKEEVYLAEQSSMALYASSDVDNTLVMNYDAIIKEFKKRNVYPIDISNFTDWEAYGVAATSAPSTMEVKWDILRDGDYSTMTLDETFAKNIFLNGIEDEMMISLDDEWVSPCAVCVNRLEKIIDGCGNCLFQLQE